MIRAIIAAILLASPVLAGEWTDLWPDQAPGANRPPAGTEQVREGWRFREVEVPQYRLFRPDEPNGMAIVILPGGGYTALAGDHEGRQFGEWFAGQGVTAVMVKYRVSSGDERGYQFPVPQIDARRAIRLTRAHADEWGIDPELVGVIGFSAGGHLASTCLTMFDDKFDQETEDAVDALSCRPSFGILVYPVISMSRPHAHGGSRRRLLGPDPDPALVKRCDTSLHVTAETPPVFLVHSADDKAVPLDNSLDFISACASRQVPVTAHIYPTGGHGYGFPGREDAEGWTLRLSEWLRDDPARIDRATTEPGLAPGGQQGRSGIGSPSSPLPTRHRPSSRRRD